MNRREGLDGCSTILYINPASRASKQVMVGVDGRGMVTRTDGQRRSRSAPRSCLRSGTFKTVALASTDYLSAVSKFDRMNQKLFGDFDRTLTQRRPVKR